MVRVLEKRVEDDVELVKVEQFDSANIYLMHTMHEDDGNDFVAAETLEDAVTFTAMHFGGDLVEDKASSYSLEDAINEFTFNPRPLTQEELEEYEFVTEDDDYPDEERRRSFAQELKEQLKDKKPPFLFACSGYS